MVGAPGAIPGRVTDYDPVIEQRFDGKPDIAPGKAAIPAPRSRKVYFLDAEFVDRSDELPTGLANEIQV